MQQKLWSAIEPGDTTKSSISSHPQLVIDVSLCKNTFAYANRCDSEIYWISIARAESLGWTLHGKAKAWEPKLGDEYWTFNSVGTFDSSWNGDVDDGKRRYGLGIYETKALAQAAFDRAKKAARGE